MAGLILNLILEKMDWNHEKVITKYETYKTFSVNNILLNETSLDKLYDTILNLKGDWISSNLEVILDEYHYDLIITFHSTELDIHDKKIFENVYMECFYFIDSLKKTYESQNINDFLDEFQDENESLILNLRETGSTGISHDIKEILELYKIEYRILKLSKSKSDAGASGGLEDVIIYILGAVSSGITWDVIKRLIKTTFSDRVDNLTMHNLEKKKFVQLRNDISKKVLIEPNKLALTNFYRTEKELFFEFKSLNENSSIITVICNSDYTINELNVS